MPVGRAQREQLNARGRWTRKLGRLIREHCYTEDVGEWPSAWGRGSNGVIYARRPQWRGPVAQTRSPRRATALWRAPTAQSQSCRRPPSSCTVGGQSSVPPTPPHTNDEPRIKRCQSQVTVASKKARKAPSPCMVDDQSSARRSPTTRACRGSLVTSHAQHRRRSETALLQF